MIKIQWGGKLVQREEDFNLGWAGRGRFYVREAAFEVSLEGLGSIPGWVSQKSVLRYRFWCRSSILVSALGVPTCRRKGEKQESANAEVGVRCSHNKGFNRPFWEL